MTSPLISKIDKCPICNCEVIHFNRDLVENVFKCSQHIDHFYFNQSSGYINLLRGSLDIRFYTYLDNIYVKGEPFILGKDIINLIFSDPKLFMQKVETALFYS